MDVVADGRLILGVGLGDRPEEYEVFGVERGTRTRRFEEAIELLKRLWTEDHVTFAGRFYQVKDVSIRPRPLQRPRPPIWILIPAEADAAFPHRP